MDKIRIMCKCFFKTPVREPGWWGAPTGEAADGAAREMRVGNGSTRFLTQRGTKSV